APALRNTTTLVQIGVPTRESLHAYRELRCQVESAVGRINARFSTPRHTPVRFFATYLTPRELAPYYLAADSALITPLRDGLHLVAFEYVACALARARIVLSVTAGAADVLREARLVNPYDEDSFAESMVGLASPANAADELRMRALKRRINGMRVEK